MSFVYVYTRKLDKKLRVVRGRAPRPVFSARMLPLGRLYFGAGDF